MYYWFTRVNQFRGLESGPDPDSLIEIQATLADALNPDISGRVDKRKEDKRVCPPFDRKALTKSSHTRYTTTYTMGFKTLLTLATLGLATAQNSVVSLFIFDADPQSLVGSVVAAVRHAPPSSILHFSVNQHGPD